MNNADYENYKETLDDFEMTYEEEEEAIARHVANCNVDGFCYTCQCL